MAQTFEPLDLLGEMEARIETLGNQIEAGQDRLDGLHLAQRGQADQLAWMRALQLEYMAALEVLNGRFSEDAS